MKLSTKSKLSKDEAALLDAAEAGNLAEVERLVAAGVNPDAKDDRRIPFARQGPRAASRTNTRVIANADAD